MAELTLTGLRVVREVAARGSFTAAAEALGYTQSAVSRQVAAMERAAGAPLFQRVARGVRPTRAGAAFLRHATAALEHTEAAMLELHGLQDRVEGRLAVGAFPTAAGTLVPRALARLAREHPGVLVALHEGSTPALLRRVRAGRLQAAVVALDASEQAAASSDLRADLLLVGRMLVAVPGAHALAARGTVRPEELEGQPWIVGAGREGDPVFGTWPGLREAPRVAFTAREWTTRLGLVAAGLGVALLPAIAAATVPAGVALLEVDAPPTSGRDSWVVTAPERSPAAEAFVIAVAGAARELPGT